MTKRKRTSKQADSGGTKSKRLASPPSRLLSLPEEIRYMIWKAVVADPILLYGTEFTRGAPMQISAIRSVALGPDYLKNPCNRNHQDIVTKNKNKNKKKKKKRKDVGPLSWLRTNRQICAEAQSVVCANLSLHVCDPLVLAALLDNVSKLKPKIVRSLSFCLRVKIEHDLRDGFIFARGSNHAGHRWAGSPCICPWCFATSGLPRHGEAMDQKFPILEEARLRMYFTCREDQGNERPVIGQLRDGRPRKTRLYRPKNPPPLAWVGDEGSLQSLADDLCSQMPLRMFRGGRESRVDMRFVMDGIEHNPANKCPQPHDQCWCKSRYLDETTLPRALTTRLIKQSLKLGTA